MNLPRFFRIWAGWGAAVAVPVFSQAALTVPTTVAGVASAAAAASSGSSGFDLSKAGAALTSAFSGFLDQASAGDAEPVGLPGTFAKIQAAAKLAGQAGLTDKLVASLNDAAAKTFPEATSLVKGALADVPWADAKTTLLSSPDGATQFLKKAVGAKLKAQLVPLVKKAVAGAGVPEQYQQLLAAAGPMATMFGKPGVSDLETLVTDKTLDSVFGYLGKEEAALRADPKLSKNAAVQKLFAVLGAK